MSTLLQALEDKIEELKLVEEVLDDMAIIEAIMSVTGNFIKAHVAEPFEATVTYPEGYIEYLANYKPPVEPAVVRTGPFSKPRKPLAKPTR